MFGYFPGNPPSTGLPLDNYTSGIFACLALERLLSNYQGPLIQVRNASSGLVQDIGFNSANKLDIVALRQLMGGPSGLVGMVSIWYDQTGQGNHFYSNSTSQTIAPTIYNAVAGGGYHSSVSFVPGSNVSNACSLSCINASPQSISKTVFCKRQIRSYPASSIPWEYGDGTQIATATGNGQAQAFTTGPAQRLINTAALGGSSGYSQQTWGSAGEGTNQIQINGDVITRSGFSGIQWYNSEGAQAPVGGGDGTPPATGSFPSWNWRLGSRTDGFATAMDVWNFVIYDADKTADMNAILSALA